MTYTIEHPLFQSRNAGKVHAQHCGNRSRYGRVLKNTVGLTLWEVKEKYGDKCCQVCLPGVAEAQPEPVEGTPVQDTDELQYEVENLGPHVYVSYAKGDARRTVKRLNTEAEAEAFIAGLKAAAALQGKPDWKTGWFESSRRHQAPRETPHPPTTKGDPMQTSSAPIDHQTGSRAPFAIADGGTWFIPLLVLEATESEVKVIDKLGKEWDLRQGRKGEWLHIPDESAVMPCIFIFIQSPPSGTPDRQRA